MSFDFWTGYWAFVSFVFGAIVGSFLNVCIWRLPRGESLSHPPSHCPACNHRLAFLPDMVPLLSQLWYRSRCRYCGVPFSWRYFWVELLTAVTFTAVYFRYFVFAAPGLGEPERTWSTLCGMIFVAALITLFFIDLEKYLIPDAAVLVAVLAAVCKDVFLIWKDARPLWQTFWGIPWQVPLPLSILGGLLGFWLLWQFAALGTALLGREAMGAGDSLLLGAMGAFLIPWPLLVLAFLFAVCLGTVGGVAGLWVASRAERAAAPDAVAEERADEEGHEGRRGAEGEPLSGVGLPDARAFPAGPEMQVRTAVLTEERPEERGEEPEAPPGEAPGIDEAPEVPPVSRWGRVWTVVGTWVAVGALWGAAAQFPARPAAGVLIGLAGAVAAAAILVCGIRMWVRGDEQWLDTMDEFMEGDPGPRFIPFGPYLVAGTLIAMMIGRPLVEWYATTYLGIPLPLLSGLGWN
jgi:leader peptidase (prepilin peptidase)/N-methyltransferase